MSNLSDIVQGGGGEVLDPSKFVFTEAELDAEIAAGSTSIVVAAPITITSSKTLNINNVRISSKSKEAVLTDDGSLTAPFFTIDAQNVSLFGLSIQCDSDIFNVIDLTANASKCEISNCTIKTDVIDVIHLNEDSSNNVISDNVLEQINLSSTFTQKGQILSEVLTEDFSNGGIFGWNVSLSADGNIILVTSYGYGGDWPDPIVADRAFARVYKFNKMNNMWEILGQDFIGPNNFEFEFVFGKINAEGNRVVFLGEGSVADITIFDYNETINQWELNTSTFTNPIGGAVTTGIIQDVPAYRAAMDINDEGTIIGALDYDGDVTIYEESNGTWIQKGPTVEFFHSAYENIKLNSVGNTFLAAKEGLEDNGPNLPDSGGFDVFTYDENINEWVRKGSEIFGLIPNIRLGVANGYSSCGISGDGNVVAIQGEINLKSSGLTFSIKGADKEQFIKTYNFKDFNEVFNFKNVLPKNINNSIFNTNDDSAILPITLIYKYNKNLIDWELLDIVTLKTSLNDFISINTLKNLNHRRSCSNIGLNYNGSIVLVNTGSSQLSTYQLNTKTKKYEQVSRLQGLELDFLNFYTNPEDINNEHISKPYITNNGKNFHYASYISGEVDKDTVLVFNTGVNPNILDFGSNNKLAGNSFEKEEKIQSTEQIRNWNSYSIGIYKDPFSGGTGSDLFYNPLTRFLGSYDEVLASNAAGIFKCPEPEIGARFRIFVMDTVTPYSTGPNAIVIEPFDTEFIIDAGQPFNSSSPNGGFTLTPGASYEFVSDGTNWFTLKT